MWSDNETDRDFLNFRFVADIAAELIAQAKGKPISMGIAGSWGVGKSSMMQLVERSLRGRSESKFLFVNFNAWLYQGYDDTRAALMETIAQGLLDHAEEDKGKVGKILDRAKDLLSRVNWFRVSTVAATTGAALVLGLPPVGLIGEGIGLVKRVSDGTVDQADFDVGREVAKKAGEGAKGLLKEKAEAQTSPPKAIHAFRDELKSALKEADATLVVLIDDLDRCLPATAISTLEAMRLFLFLDNTAFVIAADDKMIREAVRAHFKGLSLDDDLVTNYFDKLIQVPIRVPPLGTQEVRAYLMLLFIENSDLDEAERERLRGEICGRLGQTWQGKRVDKGFVVSLLKDPPDRLLDQLELADRIAPILTTAKQIAGNPRLIKRFLNTLSIRISIARSQGIIIDEAALAKMLLFERCAQEKIFAQLVSAINDDEDGRAHFLQPMEVAAARDPEKLQLEGDWNTDFVKDWLRLPPALSDRDLRGIVHVSREHLPVITAADKLSSDGAAVLGGLLAITSQQSTILAQKLEKLPSHEIAQITERLLIKARAVDEWGTPPVLYAMLTAAQVGGDHVAAMTRFLRQLPGSLIKTPIVPLLADKQWATEVLQAWAANPDTSSAVKKAIASASKTREAH